MSSALLFQTETPANTTNTQPTQHASSSSSGGGGVNHPQQQRQQHSGGGGRVCLERHVCLAGVLVSCGALLCVLCVLIATYSSDDWQTAHELTPAANAPQPEPSTPAAAARGKDSSSRAAASAQRVTFPADFMWCAATAAYQIEGAVSEDGREPSIWDEFTSRPGVIASGDTGAAACDSYHRLASDVRLLRELGVRVYRFSLSPARILPTVSGPVNEQGIQHYSALLELLEQVGIKPMVTLYHWDLPLDVERQIGGWLNASSVDWFVRYARVCFKAFAHRVPLWITFNEPWTFSWLGYGLGTNAPGHTNQSATEPYLVAHNVLLAHAAAVQMFRRDFAWSSGRIGLTLNADWAEPFSNETRHIQAAQRSIEFQLGWFADPLFFGDYPQSMRERVGARLPVFSSSDRAALVGSVDFFALNHYSSMFVQHGLDEQAREGWASDAHVIRSFSRRGQPIGAPADSSWLYVYPQGFGHILRWADARYGHPLFFITENGVDVPNENSLTREAALHDQFRVLYYRQYLRELLTSISTHGVNVAGYCAWSLLDNFEWQDGYSKRFGLYYVDYKDDFTRYPKDSAYFYRSVIAGNASLDTL